MLGCGVWFVGLWLSWVELVLYVEVRATIADAAMDQTVFSAGAWKDSVMFTLQRRPPTMKKLFLSNGRLELLENFSRKRNCIFR